MSNPFAPPSSSSSESTDNEEPRQYARRVIASFAAAALFMDAFVMVKMGRFQWAIFGRMLVIALFFGLVYRGNNWARVILVIIFGVIAVANARLLPGFGWSFWGAVTYTWTSFYLAAAAFLIRSRSVAVLVRRASSPPVRRR